MPSPADVSHGMAAQVKVQSIRKLSGHGIAAVATLVMQNFNTMILQHFVFPVFYIHFLSLLGQLVGTQLYCSLSHDEFQPKPRFRAEPIQHRLS